MSGSVITAGRVARIATTTFGSLSECANFVASVLALFLVGSIASAAAPGAPAPQPTASDDVERAEFVAEAQRKLGATFRSLSIDRVEPSEIEGIVAVYAGPQILYYAPKSEILILGEFYSASGESLTQARVSNYAASKSRDIDRTVALSLGNGPREVLVFVDPDCTYCRKAERWLAEQDFTHVRQQVFFMSMKGRPSAEARALRALCADEASRATAFREAFERTTAQSDARLLGEAASCPQGRSRLNAHAEIARKLGVYATPFFVVDGQVVAGFDPKRLTVLLAPERTSAGSP